MEFQLLHDIHCVWELFTAWEKWTVSDFRDKSVDWEVSFSIFTVRALNVAL